MCRFRGGAGAEVAQRCCRAGAMVLYGLGQGQTSTWNWIVGKVGPGRDGSRYYFHLLPHTVPPYPLCTCKGPLFPHRSPWGQFPACQEHGPGVSRNQIWVPVMDPSRIRPRIFLPGPIPRLLCRCRWLCRSGLCRCRAGPNAKVQRWCGGSAERWCRGAVTGD